jgi:hypothetical protein
MLRDPDDYDDCKQQGIDEYLDREYEWACDKQKMRVYQYFSCRTNECFRTIRDFLRDAYDDDSFNWKCFVKKLDLSDLDIYALFEFEKAWKEKYWEDELDRNADDAYHAKFG